jgi:hypothetical protein
MVNDMMWTSVRLEAGPASGSWVLATANLPPEHGPIALLGFTSRLGPSRTYARLDVAKRMLIDVPPAGISLSAHDVASVVAEVSDKLRRKSYDLVDPASLYAIK